MRSVYVIYVNGKANYFNESTRAARFKSRCENKGMRLMHYGQRGLLTFYWEYEN